MDISAEVTAASFRFSERTRTPVKILLLLSVFCLLAIPSTVHACSCAYSDPPQAFNSAQMVFIGRMLGGTEKISTKDRAGKPQTIEAGEVRFTVEEIFKGSAIEQVTIGIDSMNGTSCGPYGLRRGERYLVYAYVSQDDKKRMYTGVCTRTITVSSEYAKEDLEFLRNLPPSGVGGSLVGRIWADLRAGGATPLSLVRVKIIGPDGTVIFALTDKNGEFNVMQLKPGKYKVEPEFPANYTSRQLFTEVNVDDRGTASTGFEAYIDGSVTGRVIDQDGNSFNHVFLKLVEGRKTVYGHSTQQDGGFEVTGVPAGEYLLYIDMQAKDYDKNKPYYYPGTFVREKATVIRVGLGEKVEGLKFPLPPGALVRTIEGEVVWEDGKPAANVDVMLLCPRSKTPDGLAVEFGPTSTQTDSEGRFRLDFITGQTYWIEVRANKQGKTEGEVVPMHSPERKISLTENIKNLKLTLSKVGDGGSCGEK